LGARSDSPEVEPADRVDSVEGWEWPRSADDDAEVEGADEA
jgi:hypothetical protein